MDFITAVGTTGLGYRFQMSFSPRKPVNVFNNIPDSTTEKESGLAFLYNSLSPEFAQQRELSTIEYKLVKLVLLVKLNELVK